MNSYYTNYNNEERAVLVGLEISHQKGKLPALLDDLKGLAETAGLNVLDVIIQKRSTPHPGTFFGRGKIQEISNRCSELNAAVLVCGHELTPVQLRNLENLLKIKVIDRTQLILDIFAQRARSREGKLQVELAQLNYLLPRLTGKGEEMSRLGAGIGTRGPGETKLETDRRRIRKRISDLKRQLAEVRKHRKLHRKKRCGMLFPLVSLVGYTNAGKSTLLNALTGAGVLAEDKLFATLDPTTRRVVLPTNDTILMTDTVGFIQDLPHHLIAAFRATLEEVLEADLLLHVVDASHPQFEDQINAVEEVLKSLKTDQKPVILVLNKVDSINDKIIIKREWKRNYLDTVEISAKYGRGLQNLLAKISAALSERKICINFLIPYDRVPVISLLHHHGKVLKKEYKEDGIKIEVIIEKVWADRVKKIIKNENYQS
ncbi:MAG: GTPase HflX [Desulfotomaculum sp.]|nr:GTPase HflX [Desulfotomaculum sp.]